jgi:hypothetical protein
MRTIMVVVSVILLSSFSAVMSFPTEIVIDGEFDDWALVEGYPDDEGDTFGGPDDATMDILSYRIANDDESLYVTVTVKEDISKGETSRGAYQTVIDSDNDYNTGIQSDTEAPYPPHDEPMGVDRYISVETDTGQLEGIGMAGFTEEAEEIGGPGEFDLPEAICDVEVAANRYELSADLVSLGIELESHIRISILHYSAAGTVDWTMPAITYFVTLQAPGKVDAREKLITTWGEIRDTYR